MTTMKYTVGALALGGLFAVGAWLAMRGASGTGTVASDALAAFIQEPAPAQRRQGLDVLALVPGDARWVAVADLQALEASQWARACVALFLGEADARVVEERTGLRGGRDILALVVFGRSDLSGFSREGQSALIAHARDGDAARRLEEGLRATARYPAVARIGEGAVVAGDRDEVQRATQGGHGRPSLSGDAAMIALIEALPRGELWMVARDAGPEGLRLPDLSAALGGIRLPLPPLRSLGLVLSMDGDAAVAHLRLEAADLPDAGALRDTLRAAVLVGRSLTGGDARWGQTLSSAVVSGTSPVVELRATITPTLLASVGTLRQQTGR